jgi:hypothetical protein
MRFLYVLICVGLTYTDLYAQDAVIVVAKGSVLAGPSDSLVAVKVGSHLREGDTVKVGEKSTAIIALSDSSKLKLNAISEVRLHLPTSKNSKTWIDLVTGAVFAHVNRQKDEHFEIRTPTAVAGVRGTEFFVAYSVGGKEEENSWMCVHEGSVAITANDQTKPVVVNAGFGVSVKKGRSIPPPQRFEWTKTLNWNLDPNTGEIEDKTQIPSYQQELLKKNYD